MSDGRTKVRPYVQSCPAFLSRRLASSTSSVGSIVRRSMTTRSSRIRVMTGRSSARSRDSSASADASSVSNATSFVGSCASGGAPAANRRSDRRRLPCRSRLARARCQDLLPARRWLRQASSPSGRRAHCRSPWPDRCSASVASSAAKVILSARSARISGCCARDRHAPRPTMMPACGPPSSLSPLKQTTSTPARTTPATDGSLAAAPQASPSQSGEPLPRSSTTGTLNRRASATRSSSDARSVNPSMVKLDGCTRRKAPCLSSIAARNR